MPPLRAALAFAALLPVTAAGQDAMRPADLRAAKDATVLVLLSDGVSSGSGFVVRVDGQETFVVTNRHVVADALPDPEGKRRPQQARVAFRPGGAADKQYAAEVVAADPGDDLAVLRVRGVDAPPAPLDLSKQPDVAETSPLVAFGYPFGRALAAGARLPAVTVTRVAVGALRTDEGGGLAAVQLDGGLNPGNSGGPVLTPGGALVGVAVATIRGAGIGFAIGRGRLDAVLRGRVSVTSAAATGGAAGAWNVRVTATVADPFGKVKAARLVTRDARHGEPAPVARRDGGWPAMPGTKHELKGWKFDAVAELTRPTLRRPLWVQCEYELADGTTVRGAPADVTPTPLEKPEDRATPEELAEEQRRRNEQGRATRPLPPLPPGAVTVAELAKSPEKFPPGERVTVYGHYDAQHAFYGGASAQVHLVGENGAHLPLTVYVPRALSVDIAGLGKGPPPHVHPVRATVTRVAANQSNPAFVLTELALYDDDNQLGTPLKVEGDVDEAVKAATPPARPVAAPPGQTTADEAGRVFRRAMREGDLARWAVYGGGAVAALAGVLLVGRRLRRKNKG